MNSKLFFRVLEIGGIIVFMIAVAITILFAEGYRYDPEGKDIVKKGVIYFAAAPEGASLKIDRSVIVSSFPAGIPVLPGRHEIEIQREGYYSWSKVVEISEDEIIRFPGIRLLPFDFANSGFVRPFEKFSAWIIKSSSERGIFLFNPNLYFGKFYFLNREQTFQIKNLPVAADFKDLTLVSDNELMGIGTSSNIFLYDIPGSEISLIGEEKIKTIQMADSKIFGIGEKGRVLLFRRNEFPLSSDRFDPVLFFKSPDDAVDKFKRIQKGEKYISFLLSSGSSTVAAVTELDGTVAFSIRNIDSSFLDGDKLYYTQANKMFEYDLAEKKKLSQMNIPKPVSWFSRIANTSHFIVLTKDLDMMHCDLDMENCRDILKLDSDFIQQSADGSFFMAIVKSQFTQFDFGATVSFSERLLKDFVSYVLINYL